MKTLLWLHEKDFDHELYFTIASLSSGLNKFNLETQIQVLNNINYKKQVGIK